MQAQEKPYVGLSFVNLIRSTDVGGWDSLSLNPPPAPRMPTPAKRKQKPQAPGRSSGLAG